MDVLYSFFSRGLHNLKTLTNRNPTLVAVAVLPVLLPEYSKSGEASFFTLV